MTLNSRSKLFLAILPLSTGAGLVVYILTNISLTVGVVVVAIFGLAAGYFVWRRASERNRDLFKHMALVGFWSGLLATLAYDACRYVVVTFLHFTFWPLDIFTIFGRLIIGSSVPLWVITGVGVLYHY